MNLAHGGHISHGLPINISGKYFTIYQYGVDAETGLIDYDEVRRMALECRPKMILAGASAYPRVIDFERFAKIAKERIKPKRRMKAWEIVLLVLGSPIWLSLAVAAFAIVLSLYVVLWSVIISLWSVFGALAGCAFCGVVAGVGFAVLGHVLSGIAMVGAGLVCSGLAIFAFFGCKAATKGTLLLTKKIVLGIKKCFVGKEKAE